MPKYTINGVTYNSPTPLTDDELEELSGGVVSSKSAGVVEQMFGAGSPIARFAKGAIVDPLLGINELLARGAAATGLPGTEEVARQAKGNIRAYEKATQEGRKRIGSEGFDWTQAAGGVAGALIPGTQAPKAATGIGRIGQAAGMGAVYGGITPTTGEGDYTSEKLGQMATGAVAGSILGTGAEAASKIASIAKELVSPLTNKGRLEALYKYIQELAPNDQQAILTAVKNAKEIVPGSKPTVAEAVSEIPGATGLAAYQEALSGIVKKGISGDFSGRLTSQQAARKAAIEEIGSTPGMLDLAKSLRDFDATRNYGEAFATAITADPKLVKITRNPYIQDALPDAIKLAEANGISAKTDLTQFLHYVKISLDKQLTKTGDTALSSAEKSAVATAKSDLLKWMGSKNPAYEEARAAFAEVSKPINQMEIGQYLEQKLGTPLGNKERAAAFASAVQDAASTIKKASGQAVGSKLSDVLTPKQSAIVDNVLADLQRKAKSETLAQQSRIGSTQVEGGTELPNLLSRTATITNSVLKLLKRDANDEINRVAADMMLNPEKLAAFMQGIPKNRVNSIVEAFMGKLTPELRDGFSNTLMIRGTTQGLLQPKAAEQ